MSDIQNRIAQGAYTNKLLYPSKGDYDKFYVYSKGQVVENGITIADAEVRRARRASWVALGYTVEVVAGDAEFRAVRDAYNAEDRRLDAQFKADLTAEYDMVGHPKAELLFKKAWDQGHANGLANVVSIYDDLYDLVK
jgi:hypothetical protein